MFVPHSCQAGEFACQHNALAIGRLPTALAILNDRTASREARQVEGIHEV